MDVTAVVGDVVVVTATQSCKVETLKVAQTQHILANAFKVKHLGCTLCI